MAPPALDSESDDSGPPPLETSSSESAVGKGKGEKGKSKGKGAEDFSRSADRELGPDAQTIIIMAELAEIARLLQSNHFHGGKGRGKGQGKGQGKGNGGKGGKS